jgi:hypothetical protein
MEVFSLLRSVAWMALLLALVGCQAAPSQTAPLPGDAGGKPTGPSQIWARARPESLSHRDALLVDLQFSSRDPVARVRVTAKATGAISVKEGAEFTWEQLPPQQEMTPTVQLTATGDGSGILRVEAVVYSADGQVKEQLMREVAFLFTPEEVLSGTGGVLSLQEEHLIHLKAAGKLTPRQYELEKRKLERGGYTAPGK